VRKNDIYQVLIISSANCSIK